MDRMGPVEVGLRGVKVEVNEEESLSTKGIRERRVGISIVWEGTGAGMGTGVGEGLVGWLNSMAIVL